MTPEQIKLFQGLPREINLAIAVDMEAEAEPMDGRIGVGCVIRTRVNNSGKTYNDIILAHATKDPNDYTDDVFAFSFFNYNQPTFPRALALAEMFTSGIMTTRYTPQLQENRWVAQGIIGGALLDVTGKATHYYNPDECHPAPYWAKDMVVTTKIGKHLFLKGK